MQREPIIFVVSDPIDPTTQSLEDLLRQRYFTGYRIVVSAPRPALSNTLRQYREQGEQIALFLYNQQTAGADGATFLDWSGAIYPQAAKLLLTDTPDAEAVFPTLNRDLSEAKLYAVLDELLAEWRASTEMSFAYVKGIMTIRAVRIRLKDTLHRAAEVIALSGVGDLMVIDDDNNFVGVLSVGDVLRAAMPNLEEILEEGGTLEQAYRLFLRKGSDLMYKPIEPLVIREPLVVDPDDHVAKAATLMIEKNIHRLPVVKDGHLVGTVGRADICQAVVGTL
jgi:CBS domain-containing protein